MLTKAQELSIEIDSERLEQELLLLIQKHDVDEELGRLETHIDEVRRVLEGSGPIGRRLDFLMQELNREANTLGSKTAHVDSSNASVDLKVLRAGLQIFRRTTPCRPDCRCPRTDLLSQPGRRIPTELL